MIRAHPSRSVALMATVVPLGIGALAARMLASHHPQRLAVDFAQPLVVVTNFGSYGAEAFSLLAASIATSTALLAFVVSRVYARAEARDLGGIVAAATLGLCFAAAWPFVFSSDVYAYAAYGELALHGIDPYLPAPPLARDPFVAAARFQWGGSFPADVYGPAMLVISRGIVATMGSLGATLLGLRAAAAVAFLASIVCAHLALAALPAERRFASVCAYALNPVVLWSVAEGHNDAFVLLIASIAAIAIARTGAIGGALLGLTPLFKAPGLLLAVGFVLDATLRRCDRARWAAASATCAGLALAIAVALPPLLPGLGHSGRHGPYAPSGSLQGLVGLLPALVLAAFAVGFGLARLRRGDRRGHAWLGIALVCGLPNGYPWYALWLVPWAIAAGEGMAAGALWLVTIFATARYLPDASQTLDGAPARLLAAVSIAPLALAILDLIPRSPSKKVSVRS